MDDEEVRSFEGRDRLATVVLETMTRRQSQIA